MIQGDFEEYCQDCPELTPTAVKIYGDNTACVTIISCIHKEMCKRIYARVKEEKDNENN